MQKLLVMLMLLVITGCANVTKTNALRIDAVVTPAPTAKGEFGSVQEAIDAAPEGTSPWTVYIAPGDYYEVVKIRRSGITLIGAGQKQTRIYFDRYAGQVKSEDSKATWGTSGSPTLEVMATDVSLFDLTVENSFDFPANEKRPEDHPDKVSSTQAVAIKVTKDADRTVMQRVTLLGYQDTLYVRGGRTFVTDSVIAGHIDFIFGDANALFEYTDIISRARYQDMRFTGFVTAPSTLIDSEYGLTFKHCRLLREIDVPDNSVPLGRPWHPTTTFDDGRYANPFAIGKTTFIDTFMDAHIADVGWWSMSGKAKDGSRKDFDPIDDARFAEYGSYGPGAGISKSRPQLSDAQRKQYNNDVILAGWQPRLLTKAQSQVLINGY